MRKLLVLLALTGCVSAPVPSESSRAALNKYGTCVLTSAVYLSGSGAEHDQIMAMAFKKCTRERELYGEAILSDARDQRIRKIHAADQTKLLQIKADEQIKQTALEAIIEHRAQKAASN